MIFFLLSAESLRGPSVKIGTIQRRLAWPLRKDDTHKSRKYHYFAVCVRFDSDAGPFCFVQLRLRRPRGGSGRGFRRSLLFRLALAFANGVGGSGFGRPWLVWQACPGLAAHARACTFARPVPQWSSPGLALFVFRLRRGVSLVRARLHRCHFVTFLCSCSRGADVGHERARLLVVYFGTAILSPRPR